MTRVLGRRSLLHTALFVTVLPGTWGLPHQEVVGKRKRKRGYKCRSPRVRCGKQCLAAGSGCIDSECGICQRCDGGVCVAGAEGFACANGGVCRTQVCKPHRSLGCSVEQDSCGPGGSLECPDRPTGVNNLSCFVDAAGDPVCRTARCTNVTTNVACVAAPGAGAFVLPCALCVISGNQRICVKSVDQ